MCDCAGNSKPRKLNLPVNKNAEILNSNAVKNTKNTNQNNKNNKNNKNAANGAAVPTEKTSKTAAFIASLFAKFL